MCVCFTTKPQELTEQFRDFECWHYIPNGFRSVIDQKSGNLFEAIYEPNFLFQNHRFLQFELQHSVPLPKDTVFISFDFKSFRLDSLSLKLYLYGERERFIDSLVFQLQPDGHNLLQFNNTDTEWMEITLDGRSTYKTDTISFQIVDASFRAKNQDIDEWFRSLDFDIDAASLFPLKKVTLLDELNNKKIIGLGESVHGSRTLFKEKAEIAQKLLDKNVKLICFEGPVDVCLNWDLYVQGVHPYRYRDIILKDLNSSLSDAADMVDFLDQIRKINTTRKEGDKIHIVGLDLRSDKSNFYHYFMAHKNLSRDKQFLNPLLLQMRSLEYDNLNYKSNIIVNKHRIETKQRDTLRFEFSRLTESILSEKKLKSMMRERDYRFLLDLLSLNVPTTDDGNEDKSIDRDSVMWKIFQKAIAHYAPGESDRVVIFAHSLHLSRTHHVRYSLSGLMKIESLGSHIAENYPDDFWSMSFHVGGGEIKSYDRVFNLFRNDLITGIGKLPKPVHGSFERSAKNIVLDKFYCKSNDLGRDLYTFRMVGDGAGKGQFYFLSKDRFDAYVFINACANSRAGGYDAGYTYPDITHYTDSLKLIDMPYNKTFAFETVCFDITIPENFRYKNPRSGVVAGLHTTMTGIFESRDRHCLLIWDSFVKIYDKEASWHNDPKIGSVRKKSMIKEVMLHLKLSLEMNIDMRYYNKSSDRDIENKNFEKVYYAAKDKIVDDKGGEYAKKTFNADHVVEYFVDDNIYFMGKDYKHKQVIIIGKGEDVVTLYGYYTDQGFSNRDKYRKDIESVLKFH